MTANEFRSSVADPEPPAPLGQALTALWWDAKGDWAQAHESAQQDQGSSGAWVHAYLHRKEGDQSNAAYWYGRAGKTFSRLPLEKEWDEIVSALLG